MNHTHIHTNTQISCMVWKKKANSQAKNSGKNRKFKKIRGIYNMKQ